jgi:hypothetical protein
MPANKIQNEFLSSGLSCLIKEQTVKLLTKSDPSL